MDQVVEGMDQVYARKYKCEMNAHSMTQEANGGDGI